MKEFEKLGLDKSILNAIKERGFKEPTEIQKRAIPPALKGKDVVAGAATGSGKTLAFGSAVIQHTERGKGLQSLILTPTRELAIQIAKEIRNFSKDKKLRVATVYGGVSIDPQIRKLETAEVVVGTPGRILDHLGRRTIDMSKIKMMVLDEADRMLDMGFIDDVERIMEKCPEKKQTLFFSATISFEMDPIIKKHMNSPVEVMVQNRVDPQKLKQVYYDVPNHLKFSLLVHLLKEEKGGLVMVFCNTRRNVDFIARNLRAQGVDSEAIHGGLSQSKREKIMAYFHSQDVFVLVCTDVAARGLDIPEVSHVYNYDIPNDSKDYIHRIGRTARAGSKGKAINILAPMHHENFDRVIRDYGIDVEQKETPYVKQVKINTADRNRKHRGRTRNRRGRRSY